MFDNSLDTNVVIGNALGDITAIAEAYLQDADGHPSQLLPVAELLPLVDTVDELFELPWQQTLPMADGELEIESPEDLLGAGSDDLLRQLVNSELGPDSLLSPSSLDVYRLQEAYDAARQHIFDLVNDLVNIPLIRDFVVQYDIELPIISPPIAAPPGPQIPSESLPEDIQALVQLDLAQELGVPVDQITVENYSRQTWSDGCLGLGGPAELCLAALTEGWQVEVLDNQTNQTYVYRTNLRGDQIRRESSAQQLEILPFSVEQDI